MRSYSRQKGLCLFLFVLFLGKIAAQTDPCASDGIHEQMKNADPFYEERLANDQAKLEAYLSNKKKGGGAEKSSTTYTIPVVVHVIYTSSTAVHNISDAQIQSAIDRLNDIYSNATGTTINTGIQFQLATMDENCNLSTGIVRVSGAGVTNYSNHGIDGEVTDTDGIGASMSAVFSLSRWDPDLYMNIYIVTEIANNDGGYGTQGYAFYPSASDTYYGIVLLYNTFGYDYNNCGCYQLKSYTNQNETIAHEVGHYLNLKHTFEGGNSTTCPSTDDSAGDGVADTPAHKYITYCPTSGGNSCYASSHAFYSWDKIKYNIMGYFTETCADEFTAGQTERMLATVTTTRPYLINSAGLQTSNATIATAASCSPQSTTGLSGEYGTGITYVKINDMEASSDGTYDDGGYLLRSCFSTTIELTKTYDLAIKTWGNYQEDVRLYIDFDNNGSFSSSELVLSGDTGTSFSGTFTVPATASQGVWVRARVISDHYNFSISDGCYAPKYGQVEDYPIFIKALNPVLTASSSSLSSFITHTAAASALQSFKISATEVVSTIGVTCSSSAFELSTDGTNFSNSLSLTPSNLSLAETTIYTRIKTGQTAGSYTGTITVAYTGATSKTVGVNGTVGSISTSRGNCLSLDGNGDYVDPGLTLPSSFTIELWVKYTTDGYMVCASQTNGSHVFTILSGKLTAGNNSASVYLIDPTALTVGEWVHAAVTYDATTKDYKLYRNGMLVKSKTNVASTSSHPIYIGKYATTGYFKGDMDEVRIWNVARTEQQIRENMHLTSLGTESNLVMYYQFNGTGSTTYDYVGGRASTLQGNAVTTSASTINCGRSGASHSMSVSSLGNKDFSTAKISMNFTSLASSADFTATYQEFAPNSTAGGFWREAFSNPVWTVNQSSTSAFTTYLSFTYPSTVFTDLDANRYSLYQRAMNSDGTWTQIVSGASSITGTTISFTGVSVIGQFMVVRDKYTPDAVRGNALALDGDGDYVSTSIALPSAYTKEAWVKYTSGSTANIISATASNNGHAFWVTGGKLAAGHNGNWTQVQDASSFPVGEWTHVAVTYASGNLKLYVNGILVSSASNVSGHGNVTSYIGRFATGYYFNGEIDEVRIWNLARTEQQIRENMHLTLGKTETGLVAYYQFNDSNSPGLTKYGGNDGILNGNASLVSSSINCGREGTSHSIGSIATAGTQAFSNANLILDFTAKNGTEDFTATYQQFDPNKTISLDDYTVFDNPMWTLNRSSSTASFTVNATFIFPYNTLSESFPDNYALYYRTMSSTGDWTLLLETASAVNGDSVTFSGINQTGQFIVVQTGVTTERGKALALDGTSYLSTPLNFDPNTSPFTIESWVKINGDSSDVQYIFDKTTADYSSFLSMFVWHGKLFTYFGDTYIGLGKNPGFTYGEWHHVAMAWNTSSCYLYVDGKLAWEDLPNTVPANTEQLDFGAYLGDKYKLDAHLEEIRIWEIARTQEEILGNMHLSNLAKTSDDVVYYQMNKTLKDAHGTNEIEDGNAAIFVASGANIGESGTSQSQFGISATGVYSFANANLQFDIKSLVANLDITATYQSFEPNTTAGTDATTLYDDRTWTIHETSGNGFSMDLVFSFPSGTFSELTPSNYRLYHRTASSDGAWALVSSSAMSVTNSTVAFSGLSQSGQFMIGKTN